MTKMRKLINFQLYNTTIMRKIYIFIIALLLLAPENVVFAQEGGELSVKAQVRPRYEYNHGGILPLREKDDPISFISNRARLSLGYDNGFLSMGLSGQDISVWGQKPQIDNAANFTLNEAWVKLTNNDWFLQLGRQSLSYDDDRILGTLDWHQAGRWHDALRMGFDKKEHRLHLILAYNQTPKSPRQGSFYEFGGQPYKLMQTFHYLYNGTENLTASFLLMNLGFQGGDEVKPSINQMQTVGTHLTYNLNALGLTGSLYYQMGKTATELDLSAYMIALKGQYKFTPTFSAALGIDYLSGDDHTNKKFTAFNPLYGTHHKFYGAMDYFYASPFGNYGLVDIYGSLIFKPDNKLTIDLTYHNFSTQQPVKVNGDEKNGLGSEIDLTVTYPIRPYITLQGGYSMMFGTDAFFTIKGGTKDRMQNWMFVTLNVNPTIFKAKF
jgi:hypothetical protein